MTLYEINELLNELKNKPYLDIQEKELVSILEADKHRRWLMETPLNLKFDNPEHEAMLTDSEYLATVKTYYHVVGVFKLDDIRCDVYIHTDGHEIFCGYLYTYKKTPLYYKMCEILGSKVSSDIKKPKFLDEVYYIQKTEVPLKFRGYGIATKVYNQILDRRSIVSGDSQSEDMKKVWKKLTKIANVYLWNSKSNDYLRKDDKIILYKGEAELDNMIWGDDKKYGYIRLVATNKNLS